MDTKGQRLALVVASSHFTDQTLQQLIAPGQDAADLARVLEDVTIGGFEVKRLINRPSHEVRREIEAFFANRKRDDLLLLYFSGHGVKDDNGRLYLATTDTRRGLFRSTAVPATFVNETMTASRSRRQVLVLDCCHSGAFARGMVAKGGESVDIRDRFEGRGRVVLTASNATQYAFQGDEIIGQGSRSVFTHSLVQGLETGQADLDGDGWISLDELYDYVYDRVTDETPQQTPGKWTFDLQGDIVIARSLLGKREPAAEEARLAAQYAQGIGALTAGQWEKALRCFEALEAERPGYRDAAEQVARLRQLIAAMERQAPPPPPTGPPSRPRPGTLPEEAPQAKLARLYGVAHEAAQARDWFQAIESFQAVVRMDTSYRDAATRLARAREALAAEEAARQREAQLAALYEKATARIQARHWPEAEQLLREIRLVAPSFRDVDALLARVASERQREQPPPPAAKPRRPTTLPEEIRPRGKPRDLPR